MFNLSETAKINCHYEPFTIAGAIFRETDRTNLYSQYINIIISYSNYIFNLKLIKNNRFLVFSFK